MPKLKLNEGRCIIAHPNAKFVFAVHIKVKYGWTGDLDTTLLILADDHERARRAAAAHLVVKEGISLPLDDNHFSETLVGAIERATAPAERVAEAVANAKPYAEPEVSPAEFRQLWAGVCEAHQTRQAVEKAFWPQHHRRGCPMDSDPAFYTPDMKCTCPEIGEAQRALAIKTDGIEHMRLPAQD